MHLGKDTVSAPQCRRGQKWLWMVKFALTIVCFWVAVQFSAENDGTIAVSNISMVKCLASDGLMADHLKAEDQGLS